MGKLDYEEKIERLVNEYFTEKKTYAEALRNRYESCNHICIFGVGNMGVFMPCLLSRIGIHVDWFCDNNPQIAGKVIQGVPCISVEELEHHKADTMVIIATRYYKEIYKQLNELGFPNTDRVFHNKIAVDEYLSKQDKEIFLKKIKTVMSSFADEQSRFVFARIIEEWFKNEYTCGQLDDICSEPQYFDTKIMPLSEDEIFVDCGAYDGDTLADYMKINGGKFDKVYLFELSQKNYTRLLDNINQKYPKFKDKIIPVNSGVGGMDGEILYADDNENSNISQKGTTKGSIVTLNEYFNDQKVTFIKMDIEGAELEALKGSMKLIQKCRPKLAICLYHKPEDLFEIPLYLVNQYTNCRFYVRHHTDLLTETVLYVIPN